MVQLWHSKAKFKIQNAEDTYPRPKNQGGPGGIIPPDRGSRGAVATLAAGGSPYFNESA